MAGRRQIDYDEAVRLHQEDHTLVSIAKTMGVFPSTISRAVRLAREQGKIPAKPHPTLRQVMVKREVKLGTLGDAINTKLTHVELEWLIARLSKNAPTVADVLVDLVIEAASVDEDDDA